MLSITRMMLTFPGSLIREKRDRQRSMTTWPTVMVTTDGVSTFVSHLLAGFAVGTSTVALLRPIFNGDEFLAR